MIDAYLNGLERALPGRAVAKRRLLLEVREHLRDAAAAAEQAGRTRMDAEQEALMRLGSAQELAAGFRPLLVATALRRAALALVGGLLVAAPTSYLLSENLLPAATWPTDTVPADLAWKREALITLVGLAALGALLAFISARAGRLRLAWATAGSAAGALVAAVPIWVVLAIDWTERVPGAGASFVAAGLAAVALISPTFVFAADAVRTAYPLRRD